MVFRKPNGEIAAPEGAKGVQQLSTIKALNPRFDIHAELLLPLAPETPPKAQR